MKNMRKKFLLVLALAALLLTFTVNSALAYILDSTDPIVNTFTPATFNTEIDEDFDGEIKEKVVVKNTGSVPVYVRVAVIGNWVDQKGRIVEPWTNNLTIDGNWIERDDYYYYKTKVNSGESTTPLFSAYTAKPREDGSYLQLTIIHQSIQAEPASFVTKAWGVTAAQITQ